MTKTNKLVLSVFLFFAALNLSACATKPNQAAVAEPVPSARVTEQQSAPEPVPVVIEPTAAASAVSPEQKAAAPAVSQETAPAPAASPTPVVAAPVAASAPTLVAKKPRKAKAPKVAAPAPVVKPEPAAAPAPAPAVQKEEAKPTPPPVVSEPIQEVAEPGFLEQYWLWILGLVIVVIAVLWMARKKDAQQG